MRYIRSGTSVNVETGEISLNGRRTGCLSSGRRSAKYVLPAKVCMGVLGCMAGFALLHAKGQGSFISDDMIDVRSRILQGDDSNGTGVVTCSKYVPYWNDEFQLGGIGLCDGYHGYLVLCIFLMVYMFWALAIIVDEAFVPILDFIVLDLQIDEDVAGATFMAAGGSAPEFFTSLISVFNVTATGFGTIVGSAVFNILFVISMCGFFSRPRAEVVRRRDLLLQGVVVKDPWHFEPLPLSWWPLLRDSVSYILALIVLASSYYCGHGGAYSKFCFNEEGGYILLSESLSLFAMYIGYCLVMVFQPRMKKFVETHLTFIIPKAQRDKIHHQQEEEENKEEDDDDDDDKEKKNKTTTDLEKQEEEEQHPTNTKLAKLQKQASVSFQSQLEEQEKNGETTNADKRVSFSHRLSRRALLVNGDLGTSTKRASVERRSSFYGVDVLAGAKDDAKLETVKENDDDDEEEEDDDTKENKNKKEKDDGEDKADDDEEIEIVAARMRPHSWKGDPAKKDDILYRIAIAMLYFYALPIIGASKTLIFTYESLCAMESKVKRRIAATYSFFMSLLWIAIFTWIMVYNAETMAKTAGIPEVVLGFTLLAAGTSVPDLLSSVFVARLGYGDMAVSSSIGSNIFDLLVGLPIPWSVYIIAKGEPVAVPTGSIGVSLAAIIGMMISLIGIIIWQDWKLTKMASRAMLVAYFAFILAVTIPEFT